MSKNAIYRQDAINAMSELMRHWFGGDPKDEVKEIKRELEKLPTVQTCEDAVSRQAAINELREFEKKLETATQLWAVKGCKNIIGALPSVQPQRKTGKWIVSHVPGSMLWECNQCGFDCGAHSFNFCPMCGAKMERK